MSLRMSGKIIGMVSIWLVFGPLQSGCDSCDGEQRSSETPKAEQEPEQTTRIVRSEPAQIEAGILFEEVRLITGVQERILWIYRPSEAEQEKLPVVFIAPAGTNLLVGTRPGDGSRPEHLPYARSGFVVVSYSLDGDVDLERATDEEFRVAMEQFRESGAGVENTRAAIDFVLEHVEGVDPDHIYAAGHSSAGTLALLATARDTRIAATIAYAPCVDILNFLPKSFVDEMEAFYPGTRAFLVDSSPINHTKAMDRPVFLFYASDDQIVSTYDIEKFAEKVLVNNPRVKVEAVYWGGHYHSMIEQGIPLGVRWLTHIHR